MNVVTYEGVVENGSIQLPAGAVLPEKAKVYVLVPGLEVPRVVHIRSPQLVDSAQAAQFKLEVIKESKDAGV
jgi:hypothetical protein